MSRAAPRVRSAAEWWCWTTALLIASCVLGLYYAAGWHRGEETSVLILYRPTLGDRDYFPLARQFAQGQFGDGYTSGLVGQGWVGFPGASVIGHGLALRWLGPVGFAVIDILTPCAYLIVATRLLQAAGASRGIALGVALFFALQGAAVTAAGIFATFGYALRAVPFFLEFLQSWELRFPRNFVTEIFVLGALGNWCELARTGLTGRPGWWIGTAAWMAAVLQSDIYSFIALTLAFVFVGAAQSLYLPKLRPRILAARIGLLIAVGAFLSLPFLLQRRGVGPDILERFGVFAVPRAKAWDLTAVAWSFFPKTFDFVAFALPWLAWLVGRKVQRPELCPTSLALGLSVLQLAGFLAMSSLVGTTGQAVQLYHFRDTARTLLASTSLISLALLLTSASGHYSRWVAGSPPRRMVVAMMAGSLLLFLVWSAQLRAEEHLANPGQPRDVAHPSQPIVRNYRADLRALIPVMDQAAANGFNVLATADAELYSWWTGLRGRQSFLAHTFVSSLDNETLFQRLALFAHYNQVASGDFVPWLVTEGDTDVGSYWYSGNRYQATSLHTFAPTTEYSEAERKAIAQTSPLDCWRLIIPQSERQRLAQAYEAVIRSPIAASTRVPDLIVLTTEFPTLHPDPSRFRLLYENPTFRLFGAKRS